MPFSITFHLKYPDMTSHMNLKLASLLRMGKCFLSLSTCSWDHKLVTTTMQCVYGAGHLNSRSQSHMANASTTEPFPQTLAFSI